MWPKLEETLAPECRYPSGVEDALSNYQNEISARASGLVPIKEHVATESYLTQSLASSTLMPSTNRTGQTQASSRTGQTEEPPITKTLSASEVRSMGYARRGSNVSSVGDITGACPQARHSAFMDNDNDDGSANRSSGKTLKGMKKLMSEVRSAFKTVFNTDREARRSKVRSAFKTVFNTDGEADGSRTPTSTEPEPRSPTRTIPDLAAPLINPAMSGDVPDCTYRTSRSVQSHFLNDDLEKGSASSRPLSLKKPMDIPSPVGIPRRRTEHYERIKTISFSAGGAGCEQAPVEACVLRRRMVYDIIAKWSHPWMCRRKLNLRAVSQPPCEVVVVCSQGRVQNIAKWSHWVQR
eukprot:gene16334-22525_t